MRKAKILDSLYEELCGKIVAPDRIREKSFEAYDKVMDLFKKSVKSDKIREELVKRLNDFIFLQDDEFEYERKEIFKIGYNVCNTLKVELGELKVIIDGKNITLDNEMFEKLYDERVEEMAVTTKEEQERDKNQIKSIAFKELAPKLSEEEIRDIELAINEYVDSVYFNFREYCKKYYYNGIKDTFDLTFVCKRK